MSLLPRVVASAVTLAASVCCLSAPTSMPEGMALFHSRSRDIGFEWKYRHGDSTNAQLVECDDSGWETIDLPHDWSIAGPKEKDNPGKEKNGYFPGGIGWYRKHFQLPSDDKDKLIFVQFDGVYENSEVWINGHSLGVRPYGYTSFQYELTPHMKFGGDNILAVRVDNTTQPNSRWYTGCGIYRLVHLIVTDKLHVKQWGTEITTPGISQDQAIVRVRTEIQNSCTQSQNCTLVTRILDSNNKVVGEMVSGQKLAAQGEHKFDQEIKMVKPELWSINNPNLYCVQTLVKNDQGVCDEAETSFGMREARFDKDKGFVLNGEQVKLKGVCLHHDAGSLGAAVPVRAWERRLEILKSIGCNAIRTSHNPPSPELLDLCDRMGFVVIDEAFDKWSKPYGRFFPAWGKQDLVDMIRRDRNHPSVVMWSVGNELGNQGEDAFMKQLKLLVALTRDVDPPRPVTCALKPFNVRSREENAKKVAAIARLVDVIGCNYQEQWFADYRQEYPGIIIVATESYPYYRGQENDLAFKTFDPVNPWLDAAAQDYVAGTFYWAGIDYLGEAAAGWPFHGWNCSLVDACGFIRPVAYLQKSFWIAEPMVHLAVMDNSLDVPKPTKVPWDWPKMVSHWNLPQQLIGKKVKLVTFSNCPTVELLLNGRSMGVKKLADYPDKMITWEVPYQVGVIEARGLEKGQVKASHRLQTAGVPAQIRLIPDRSRIQANGRDLCYVEVQIVDKNGIVVPSAQYEVHFRVEGAGKIAGVDNGDLTSMESYKGDKRQACYGRAQVILQSARKSGSITLTARTEGLPASHVTIESVSVADPSPSLPDRKDVIAVMDKANDYFVARWHMAGTQNRLPREFPSHIWTRAVYFEGAMALYRVTRSPAVLQYVLDWAAFHKWGLSRGDHTRNADNQAAGQTYLELYLLDPLQKERAAHVRANLDYWIASKKLDYYTWIDALQMSMPVFARLAVIDQKPAYLEAMHALYDHAKTKLGLYNPEDRLWWRDVHFKPPVKTPAGKPIYWSRGNGWVLAALVRVMDVLPKDAPHYAEYESMFKDMCTALLPLQREDGFWNASLADPGHFGGPETSGTALFIYGFAWGVKKGVLPADTYVPAITKGWNAIGTQALHPDGFLGYVQGTGDDPSDGQAVTYDSKPDFEDYGLGCVLLAGSEICALEESLTP